jgi:hypothetical protein
VTEQLRVVLVTYRDRPAFRVLAAISLPVLLVSYFMAFSALPDNPALGYFILAAPLAVIFTLFLGDHLKLQFASFRSKLLPGYRFSHLAAALLLFVVVTILTGAFAFRYTHAVAHISGGMSLVGIGSLLSILWAISLLSFATGYFLRPVAFWVLALALQLSIGNSVRAGLVSGLDPRALFALLMFDAILTSVLLKRMLHLNESMFEYRNKDDARETQRYWWARYSEGGTWLQRLFGRGNNSYLDHITYLPGRFLEHVRHFEESSAMSEWSLVSMAIWLIVVLWAANWITIGYGSADSTVASLSFLTVLPALTAFSGSAPTTKKSLQSIFLLPLDRNKIVSRYGCALFVILLKNWLSYAFAAMVVAWMPLPGRIHGIPPVNPLFNSLTAQLPIFGLLSFALGRSRGVIIGLAALLAAIFGLGSELLPKLFPAVQIAAGLLLIWLSYRHWCQAEIID